MPRLPNEVRFVLIVWATCSLLIVAAITRSVLEVLL